MQVPRICHMWSGPRNVSTALMYSFAQRGDAEVVDEPLYAHYLDTSGRKHPGDEVVLAAQDIDAGRVVRRLQRAPSECSLRFCKQMAHHLRGVDLEMFADDQHFLLIRAPEGVITSLVNQLPDAELVDTGYQQQVMLLERFGNLPVVDSSLLLKDPESILGQLCGLLDIPFSQSMLSWPAGPKPYDGVWARWWYDNVHQSTHFAPPRELPHRHEVPAALQPLLAECRPLYDQLRAHAIQP